MKIKTELLKNMVAKAIKCSSNNKDLPLTGLIGIEVKENILTLTTVDENNQLRVKQNVDGVENFYTIVNAETFSKLVSKVVTEYVELNNKENYLEVKANKGVYKLEIAINEEGEMVKFPEIPEMSKINKELEEIDIKALKDALEISKSSVAKTLEIPFLTGYYIGDNQVLGTDRQLICNITANVSKEPILISSEMAELLKLIDEEKVNLLKDKNNLIFYTDTITISGKELDGKELYPVSAIINFAKLEYLSNVKVNRQNLLLILDRMKLFVNDSYDKNGIYLKFSSNGLEVRSQKSNAIEILDIEQTDKKIEDFECLVDIEMLRNQLNSLQGEFANIYYGQDKSIELKEDNIIIVISLLEKSN